MNDRSDYRLDTHRVAVDHIDDGTCETYCGLVISLFDEKFDDNHRVSNPSCPKCREEMEKCGKKLEPLLRHYVMRSYSSHASKNLLIKVMSRGFVDIRSAENWKDFCASEEKNKRHKFYIVSTTEII